MLSRAWCAVSPISVLCCFVAFFPTVVLGDAASYEGKTISRIVFVPSDQPLEAEEIHRILPVKGRAPLRLDQVRSAIDRLYATGTYADIQVDAELRDDQVILRFITQNNWFIGKVS